MPGFIKTPMTEKIPEKVLDKICKSIPLGRMGHPDEIAVSIFDFYRILFENILECGFIFV